jgi:hypothetical protein
MGAKRPTFRCLVGMKAGKRPLGKPRRRWEDNIKINLRERYDVVVCTGLIWLRLGTSVGLL